MAVFVGNILGYVAVLACVVGLAVGVWAWRRAPAAPPRRSRLREAIGLLWESTCLGAVLRRDKLVWAVRMAFRACIVLVVVRHLRYFVLPVPAWVAGLHRGAAAIGVAAVVAAAFLLMRRAAARGRARTSATRDWAAPALLIAIALSGLCLKTSHRVNLVEVKHFALSMVAFRPVPPPTHGPFLLHLLLVLLAAAYLPWRSRHARRARTGAVAEAADR